MALSWSMLQEIKRKAIHGGILLVIILYTILEMSVSKEVALLVLVFLLLMILGLEYIRLELQIEIPLIEQFIRAKELRRMTAAVYFMVATIISLAVFDFKIALAALLMTTFGDMVAALTGRAVGKTLLFRNKTVQGTLAELLVNLIIGFILLENIYIIIGMALTATIVETFVVEMEDNLFVPLFSGFVGQLLLML
ncbi:CTP--2,3-di-O-geranylgeranyl-sn-glycero-1-phosphate cytidyltransferase [Candidatus Woesearchaeota archaeon]|nr:CTP--2,3-di-O-geranylgeranyl-sn-glycero-1-phosphate cytidyltransferase [Candidatus Woesearchaeota archaeon]